MNPWQFFTIHTITKCGLHLITILINVSQAISWTPSWDSCINSNNLLITVFRNFQWTRRKRGYCPTTYIIFEAITALLSLPRFCSHRPRRSKNKPISFQFTWTIKKFNFQINYTQSKPSNRVQQTVQVYAQITLQWSKYYFFL